jgi:hypothetical protein
VAYFRILLRNLTVLKGTHCKFHDEIMFSNLIRYKVRFQVLAVTSTKVMITFWDIAACSLVVVDQSFRGVYCSHYQGDEFIHSSPS